MITADILGERARLTPQKTALVDLGTGQRLSYEALNERAIRCAHLWRDQLGLRKGDRVGILAHNRVEYLDAFFAAAKTGIILVTLGTRLTARELASIAQDAGIRALLFGGGLGEIPEALASLLDLEFWIALDPKECSSHLSYPELTAQAKTEEFSPTPCNPEDVYCLLYTSGTTGKPKGVMIPHRMVAWNGYNTVAGWQLREDDVSPVFTPLYHAGGLLAFIVPIFVIGGTIILHAGFDTQEIWQALVAERCTVVLGVPTIWKMLLEAPEFAEADLSAVRWFISGGAPLPEYLIRRYQDKGVTFKQGFGMTEVGVNCFAMSTEDSVRKAGSIGRPMMLTEVRLQGEGGSDVPCGEVGEMLFRGPHVCLGYWNDPEATASALDSQGWFHSGDLAHRDEEGFFYIAGRSKDIIISGGVNIFPAEIEANLLRHPLIEDAAVVGVPHETWGEMCLAFVVPRGPAVLEADQLRHFLSQELARFKIPKEFRFVSSLPRTAYGKVIKGRLRESYLQEKERV